MAESSSSGHADVKTHRICFITGTISPKSTFADLEDSVIMLLEAGVRWVQYREKNKAKRIMFYEAQRLREVTRRFNALFVVNDHADIALAVEADGVHLGQDDLPVKEARKIMGSRIIGISTHNIREAVEAEEGGADYIGFGSIFSTATKEDAVVQGLDALRRVRQSVRIPVIAIGGINADNVRSVFGAGCEGVALSSGLLAGPVQENMKKFLSAIEEA